MKAMILAAGLGTRLAPLSEEKPKALMPIGNRPIISRTIDLLDKYGITQIVINAHHHSQQLIDYFKTKKPNGLEIDIRVEPKILGHGGGIRNTLDFWDDEPFIVINSDILTDINLDRAYSFHRKSGGLATMVLHDFERDSQILMDEEMKITDIAPSRIGGRLAFTGIHIIEPDLLTYIPEGEFSSIIDCYCDMIKSGRRINGYLSSGHYWWDINTAENYLTANKEILALENTPFCLAQDIELDISVKLLDWAVIGSNCKIGEKVNISGSVVWDGSTLENGSFVKDSIVTPKRIVKVGDMKAQGVRPKG
jgi:mannose-1-phosphate guanylyltransferase